MFPAIYLIPIDNKVSWERKLATEVTTTIKQENYLMTRRESERGVEMKEIKKAQETISDENEGKLISNPIWLGNESFLLSLKYTARDKMCPFLLKFLT